MAIKQVPQWRFRAGQVGISTCSTCACGFLT